MYEIEREQQPRGPLTISGTRGGQAFDAMLPPGDWRISVPTAMSEALMSIYQEAGKLLAAKEPENAAKRWLQAAAQARADGSWTLAAWLCLKAATYSPTRDEVYAAYRMAADMANASASLTLIAFVLESEARRAESFGDVDKANERYREVLRIRETPLKALSASRELYVT